MDVRARKENRTIKIGVIELFSNGKENAIKPFNMPTSDIESHNNHADNVIKVIRTYIPNAEIHLVRADKRGIEYLIEQDVAIVNMSLTSTYVKYLEDDLAKTSFLITSAGNTGDKGEGISAMQDYWYAVGAVDSKLNPCYYSSYGYDAVETVAQEPIIEGKILHGTSFTAPVITGLIAQWYIWYFNLFNCYPSVKETYDFIKYNSQDVFEDGKDARTGYGLLRLPKQFKASEVIVKTGNRIATKIKHVEGEQSTEYIVDLLVKPFIHENRTMVGSNGLTSNLGINVHWNNKTRTSHYIRG